MFKKLFNKHSSLIYKRKARELAVSIFRYAFLIGIAYLILFPVLYMCITAFQSVDSASDPTVVWIPKQLSLEPIKVAMKLMSFWKSLALTATITLGGTVFSLISCSLTGYGLARFKFKGKALVLMLVILTIIIPPQVLLSSNYILFRFFDFGGLLSLFGVSLNLIDSPAVFIVPAIFASGIRNGIFIFIFYSFFQGLPYEMEEAAKIDGCGIFKTFVRVMLPLAVPCFVTVLLFSIVWHWTEYNSASIYFTQEVQPLMVTIPRLKTNINLFFAESHSSVAIRMYIQAACFLIISPILVLFAFTQKYFTESIERTGLVG